MRRAESGVPVRPLGRGRGRRWGQRLLHRSRAHHISSLSPHSQTGLLELEVFASLPIRLRLLGRYWRVPVLLGIRACNQRHQRPSLSSYGAQQSRVPCRKNLLRSRTPAPGGMAWKSSRNTVRCRPLKPPPCQRASCSPPGLSKRLVPIQFTCRYQKFPRRSIECPLVASLRIRLSGLGAKCNYPAVFFEAYATLGREVHCSLFHAATP